MEDASLNLDHMGLPRPLDDFGRNPRVALRNVGGHRQDVAVDLDELVVCQHHPDLLGVRSPNAGQAVAGQQRPEDRQAHRQLAQAQAPRGPLDERADRGRDRPADHYEAGPKVVH